MVLHQIESWVSVGDVQLRYPERSANANTMQIQDAQDTAKCSTMRRGVHELLQYGLGGAPQVRTHGALPCDQGWQEIPGAARAAKSLGQASVTPVALRPDLI